MPQINRNLLEKLMGRLGVSKARVYAIIQQTANGKMLDRHHAALVLAAEHNINIQKYSSPQDRAAIRGALNSGDPNGFAETSAQMQPQNPKHPTRKKQLLKASKAKDNSVFVVHGRDEGLRKSMFEFLRALSLNPMEWSKAVLLPRKGGVNPHVDDILDAAMARVQAVVVIFSPDDLVS